jgi:hypothetical protein
VHPSWVLPADSRDPRPVVPVSRMVGLIDDCCVSATANCAHVKPAPQQGELAAWRTDARSVKPRICSRRSQWGETSSLCPMQQGR